SSLTWSSSGLRSVTTLSSSWGSWPARSFASSAVSCLPKSASTTRVIFSAVSRSVEPPWSETVLVVSACCIRLHSFFGPGCIPARAHMGSNRWVRSSVGPAARHLSHRQRPQDARHESWFRYDLHSPRGVRRFAEEIVRRQRFLY